MKIQRGVRLADESTYYAPTKRMMMGGRGSGISLVLYLCGFILAGLATIILADEPELPEYQVKADMLYKLLSYVEWPSTAFTNENEPYKIGVAGSNHLERELRRITSDQVIKNRQIKVIKLTDRRRNEDFHMIYVGPTAKTDIATLLGSAKKKHLLLVTENNDKSLEAGGVINFRKLDERIVFDVSLINAERFKLKLSARLLAVAASVEKDGG